MSVPVGGGQRLNFPVATKGGLHGVARGLATLLLLQRLPTGKKRSSKTIRTRTTTASMTKFQALAEE
jgi:hypothetical protein